MVTHPLARDIREPRIHRFRDGSVSFTDAAVLAMREEDAVRHRKGWETRRAKMRARDPLFGGPYAR
jgi:hypothetical protein